MSKTSPNSDRGAQKKSGRSSISRRGVLKATGAGLAGAGLSSVTGTASAAGLNISPLARDGNQIVDPSGNQITLHGVSIADPGESARQWRGMDSSEIFDMATSHDEWSNTLVRVPMEAEFIYSGDAGVNGAQAPAPGDLPHGDDWGPALPGTYGVDQLEAYCDAYIDDLVQQAEDNGAYIMLDYHRHYPVFHHEEHTNYVEGHVDFENRDGVELTQVWECNSTNSAPHTAHGNEDFPIRPNKGRNGNTCGERGLLWHGADQKEEIMQITEEQEPWEYFEGEGEVGPNNYTFESIDDVYLEPDAVCHAMDGELQQFWEYVADRYGDSDAVIFDIYNEPTGPYAGDWGGPERPAGALSQTPDIPEDIFELWSEYAKPYYDLWKDRSEPWVQTAEDNGQGQVMTIGNPRWSQYVHWAPYNEYDAENMAYTSHVYLQDNCRPLEDFVGQASEHVPVFFSEFGWMDFDLTVPTPWMTREDHDGIEWWEGDEDPTGGMSYSTFIDEFDVHPVCWAFDHTWEPNFFEHGTPGMGDGAKGDDHWYDNGYLITDGSTPGGQWQEYVNDQSTSVSSGSSRYDGDFGPSDLDTDEEIPSSGYATDYYVVDEPPEPPEGDCADAEATAQLDNGQTVCDLDGDGNYMDVTGDGSVSNSDVTEFFGNQHVDPWDSATDMFDFDGDNNVSQADVIELFRSV